jgi:glycerate 2-kinase
MAGAFSALALAPGVIARGVIAGPQVGHAPISDVFESFDAGHPDPNAQSAAAGARALALAREARAVGGWLVVLLSGGASALLAAPAAGITLDDKLATARALMRAGASIGPLNCVRKHLSDIKGGQLAAAAGRTVTLAISDVHGPIEDDPAVIGSGPTIGDPTTFAEAAAIVHDVPDIPSNVRDRLERGARGEVPETIKPGDPRLAASSYEIIGNRRTAVAGAKAAAESLGYVTVEVVEPVQGEARIASRALVALARKLAGSAERPLCILAGGETTVTVRGQGLGGRNQEFVLSAIPAIETLGRAAVLASVGTDGIDGPTDAAGALIDSDTLVRAARLGLDWESALDGNDAYHFFQPLGDLLRWGPTGTNVGDVQLLLLA